MPSGPVTRPHATSQSIFDGFIEHSWRSNALRQREKGVEFVIGRRERAYLWNVEGTKRVIDCGTGGGVHSLGHRHPDVVRALKDAIDAGRDTGLWSFPNEPYLLLQDELVRLAPVRTLDRAVVTHSSTVSVDVAAMFAFRMTGRNRLLAYRHGYHGHSGFAAMVTGSAEEGVIGYYHLPSEHSDFLETYGDPAELEGKVTEDVAAVIVEPMQYETFAPAPSGYLQAVAAACREKGALFIIDETRTGLGRTGRLWGIEHHGVAPDMLITGKGLSGGMYPVSALLMTRPIYDRCMNEHRYAYISSLGGNEIACLVARKVLELSSDAAFLRHTEDVSRWLRQMVVSTCRKHGDVFEPGTTWGCIATLRVKDAALAPRLFSAAFEEGVLCHSVSVVEPTVLKLLPPLVIDEAVVAEIGAALDRAAERVRRAATPA